MFVVGTAGHVDHGKSTLVHALTGMDPDRLAEEKARGLTIDLGFAWLQLPGGRDVSIVDVPGHERFVRNMLAGVGGVDLALIVIAADEGVMPQTHEHVDILNLLGISQALVALTKVDLVDNEWLDMVREEVRDWLATAKLESAPIVDVSATTGRGLDLLLSAIEEQLADAPTRQDRGAPRVPIDRAFTVQGFGTVVTGTLLDGSLAVGDELEITPPGIRTRVRGLQTHRSQVDLAGPGARVAINLTGVAVSDLTRGMVAARPGALHPTRAFDVWVEAVRDGRLRHNQPVTCHSLAAEAPARLRLLEHDQLEDGAGSFAQIILQDPLALLNGDRFVLRANGQTIGGGRILALNAGRHRRRHPATLARLNDLLAGTPADRLLSELSLRQPRARASLLNAVSDASTSDMEALIESGAIIAVTDDALVTPAWLSERAHMISSWIDEFHRQWPLRFGIDREELKSRLGLPTRTYEALVERLHREGTVRAGATFVALPVFTPQLTPEDMALVNRYIADLQADPTQPASTIELPSEVQRFIEARGDVVRISTDVVFAAADYARIVGVIIELAGERGSFSVADVRDHLSSSRKYVLALLEYLDERRITRRVGDERVLRNASRAAASPPPG